MAGISLDKIRDYAREKSDHIEFSEHAKDEIFRRNLTTSIVLQVIENGTVSKKETDEQTENREGGAFTKYTLDWKNFRVTVKNSPFPRILSARVKDS